MSDEDVLVCYTQIFNPSQTLWIGKEDAFELWPESDLNYNHSQDEAIYTPLTHSDKPV